MGAHFSIARGFRGAFEEAYAVGATALQIFAKSPMSGRLFEVPAADAEAVRQFDHRLSIRTVVIHASYLINLAKPMSHDGYEIASLTEDLCSIEKLGGQGVVLHFGKALKELPETAEAMFVKNVLHALEKTKGLSAAVILENTAGQGTELGYRLPDYGRVFRMFKGNKRIRACIDTAHLMGAGYDLSKPQDVEKTIDLIEMEIGFDKVACVHFNDSKKPAGSRVDRHEDIGKGTVGLPGLKTFARGVYAKNPHCALILETPEEHLSYKDQLEIMKSWFA